MGNNREYYAAESLRKSEKDRITSRRELRRTRRNRLRYRKARFDNRRRKDSWLAPSIQHRLDFTIKEIKRLYMFLPITNLVVEVTPFDNQKLLNPDIQGWQYKLERPTKVKLVFHKSGKDALPIPNTTKGKNELLGYIMLENKKFYQENNRPYYPWYVERYKKFLDQKIF